MRFPNAYAGVKKIFTAEIINLIAAVVWVTALVIAVVVSIANLKPDAVEVVTETQLTVTVGGLFASVILMIIGGSLSLVAYVLQTIGVGQAMRDESYFKTAFIFIFIGIVSTALSCIPDTIMTDFFISMFKAVSQVSHLVITVYIVGGIQRLASKMGETAIEAKGSLFFVLLVSFYGLGFIANLVGMFAPMLSEILAVSSLIIDLVAYIILLSYLSQAKKMLAR